MFQIENKLRITDPPSDKTAADMETENDSKFSLKI